MIGSAVTIITNCCKQAAQECNQIFTQESIIVMLIILFIFITVGTFLYIQRSRSFHDYLERREERHGRSKM